MPRAAKKVLAEIALDSESEVEPQEIIEEEPPKKLVAAKKKKLAPAAQEKKMEALRIANEARLRRKIERELIEKQQEAEAQERALEEKIMKLIGRQATSVKRPAKNPAPKKKKQEKLPSQSQQSQPQQSQSQQDLQRAASPPAERFRSPSPRPHLPNADFDDVGFDEMYNKIFGR